MGVTIRDPIAGLVLAVCAYLAKVEKGTPDEIHELFMVMITKAAAVERAYGRGTAKPKRKASDGEESR